VVSLQLLQQQDLAEVALQEPFVRIWHNASKRSQERGSVISWMISIVRYDSCRQDALRKNARG